jgi:hypothetical protein
MVNWKSFYGVDFLCFHKPERMSESGAEMKKLLYEGDSKGSRLKKKNGKVEGGTVKSPLLMQGPRWLCQKWRTFLAFRILTY